MLFNFTLAPVEVIRPWGTSGNYRLHWFGLTDGEYWIQAGKATLFEYSDGAQEAGAGRYCNYQVVRLYEDLMEMLPHILEPMPESLAPYMRGDSAREWQKIYDEWLENNCTGPRDGHLDEIMDMAVMWTGGRRLDSAYLSPSANIAMWSDEKHVHIEWDNRDKLLGGKAAWSAALGSFQLPRHDFIEEVKSFHFRLMEQMRVRVEQVVGGVLAPGIAVDLPGLVREHERRSHTLETAMSFQPKTDWKKVEEAIREIREV